MSPPEFLNNNVSINEHFSNVHGVIATNFVVCKSFIFRTVGVFIAKNWFVKYKFHLQRFVHLVFQRREVTFVSINLLIFLLVFLLLVLLPLFLLLVLFTFLLLLKVIFQ